MNEQFANYIRGKVLEIVIVGIGDLCLLRDFWFELCGSIGIACGIVCGDTLHRCRGRHYSRCHDCVLSIWVGVRVCVFVDRLQRNSGD